MASPTTVAALLTHLRSTTPTPLSLTPAEYDRLTNISWRISQFRDAPLLSDYAELLAEMEAVGVQGWLRAAKERERGQVLHEDHTLANVAERLERVAGTLSGGVTLEEAEGEDAASAQSDTIEDRTPTELASDAPTKPKNSIRRSRPFSLSSVVVEVGSSRLRSPTTSTSETTLARDTEYPPPSAPISHFGEDDEAETRDARRLEEETASWAHEQNELQASLPPPSQVEDYCSAAFTSSVSTQPYIFIPLPANFTLPQHDTHLPSLTFTEPPLVFHFPDGAKKADLLAVLHHRHAAGLPGLLPRSGVNVMQVRTHRMEWELKNAVRKVLGKEGWDGSTGETWYTEGRGDTYIVSNGEVIFHGVSGETSHWGNEDHGHVWSSGTSEAEDDSTAGSVVRPHLRGGADRDDLFRLEDRERLSYAALRSGTWRFSIPDDYREVLDDVQYANSPGFQRAYIEHARILQLQNAAQNRSIERLQEMLQDVEGTVEWQDEKLGALQRNMEHREHELVTAREEVTKLENEVQELREVLGQINAQVGAFCHELEDHLVELGLCDEVGIRGGNGDPELDESSSSWETVSGMESAFSHDVDIQATAFYFFPSMSIMILLTYPVHYFQWPRNTSLEQVYAILKYRQSHNLENNPHLRHIREILEIREELGFPLPDTSDGLQVLISLPEKDIMATEQERECGLSWDRTFGPDAYETMLKEQVAAVDVSARDYHAYSSKLNCEGDGSFCDSDDLVNATNQVIDPIRMPQEVCDVCGEVKRRLTPEHYVDIGMQNPYASPRASVRGGRGRGRLNPPPSFMPSSILYPPVIKETQNKTPGALCKRSKPIVPEDTKEFPHPARMPERRIWNVVRYPHDEQSGEEYEASELERSANYDFELGMECQDATSPHAFSEGPAHGHHEVDDGEAEKWRHRKGEGCESWLDQATLDPSRPVCTFCHLPWAEDSSWEWQFEHEPRPRGLAGKSPANSQTRPSPKTPTQPAPFPSSMDTNFHPKYRCGLEIDSADSAEVDMHESRLGAGTQKGKSCNNCVSSREKLDSQFSSPAKPNPGVFRCTDNIEQSSGGSSAPPNSPYATAFRHEREGNEPALPKNYALQEIRGLPDRDRVVVLESRIALLHDQLHQAEAELAATLKRASVEDAENDSNLES